MMGHVSFSPCKTAQQFFSSVPSRYHQRCRHLTSTTPHMTKQEVVIPLYSLWLQGHSCGQLSPGHYLLAITQAAAQATIPRQHTRVLGFLGGRLCFSRKNGTG